MSNFATDLFHVMAVYLHLIFYIQEQESSVEN